jgi:hypothetical protein
MRLFYTLFITAVLLASFTNAKAQSADTSSFGFVKGIVFDTKQNYALPSASIAIYRVKDSGLVNYQLSNNYGEFKFNKIPKGIPLRITVSYIGYKSLSKSFNISQAETVIDFNHLNLERTENQLGTVVVASQRPPIQMNGDTLEFNADAFKIDKNAVVEDLLRRLPGITLWGDGTITVNGKRVNSVLVDGKLFFSDRSKIAIQNLPKDAVDKIQVYKHNQDKNNKTDSITDINIKLKKNKRTGIFGKLGIGYGTDSRYESDDMLAYYNPKTQIALVYAGNNLNKVATTTSSLIENASFKGVGANVEYQPNFSLQGITHSNYAGASLHHDFISNSNNYDKKNGIDANYLFQGNDHEENKELQTTNLSGDGSRIVQNSRDRNISITTGHDLSAKYNWVQGRESFYFLPVLKVNQIKEKYNNDIVSTHFLDDVQSVNHLQNESINNLKAITIQLGYKKNGDREIKKKITSIQLDYSFDNNRQNNSMNRISNFYSKFSDSSNHSFNRRYDYDISNCKQTLDAKIGDLKNLLFGRRILENIKIEFQNYLLFAINRENSTVKDIDSASGKYIYNKYLTNNRKSHSINDRAGISFMKIINKGLSNRYKARIAMSVTPQMELFYLDNSSYKMFQNLTHKFANFTPAAEFSSNKEWFGEYQSIFRANYKKSIGYPDINQLVPLVDSSDVLFLQFGNKTLKEYKKHEIEFALERFMLRLQNNFNYSFKLTGGLIENNIRDSIIYDSLGRSRHFPVNINGTKYLTLSGSINKALKARNHQVQVVANSAFSFGKDPGYINGNYNLSNSISTTASLGIYYSYEDLFVLNLEEQISSYIARQGGFESNDLHSKSFKTTLSTSWSISKSVSISSNIGHNLNSSSNYKSIDFTIWNASINYRLLSSKTMEVKFSALDLLHQNTSVINYGSGNSFTTGITNVLQQYFLVTLAYYPRKFGSRATKK